MAINIREEYGCGKGDDDTQRIQDAIDQILIKDEKKKRGAIYFPEGTYKISKTIKYHEGTVLFGDSLRSVLLYSGNGTALMNLGYAGGVTIRSLMIRREEVIESKGSIGIDCGNTCRSLFQDLYIQHFNIGVLLGKSDVDKCNYHNNFHNVRVAGPAPSKLPVELVKKTAARGFVIGRLPNPNPDPEPDPGQEPKPEEEDFGKCAANANYFVSCEAFMNLECGFDFVNATGCTVRSKHIANCRDAIRIGEGCSSNFIEAYVEACETAGRAYRTSKNNIIKIYRDGRGSISFEDFGWNNDLTFTPDTGVVDDTGITIYRAKGESYTECEFSYLPAVGKKDIFRIIVPQGAAAIVSITMVGSIPYVKSYSEVSEWHICNVGGKHITCKEKSRTISDDPNSEQVISVDYMTSQKYVTFQAVNEELPPRHSGSKRKTTFFGTIKIQGLGIIDFDKYPLTRIGFEKV